jgi:hypothetical protein
MRRQEVSHLGFPGAETPKPVFIAKLILGFTSRDFATGEYKGTDPWVSRVSKHRNIQTLDTLCHFGISQASGEYKRLAFRYPRCRNTISHPRYSYFVVSCTGSLKLLVPRPQPPLHPELRIAKISKSDGSTPVSGFREPRVCDAATPRF